jgi:hypothetical protein
LEKWGIWTRFWLIFGIKHPCYWLFHRLSGRK